MYTWGYLKNVILAKLDQTEEEANTQDFISRFPYFANEAMTQICSAVKPKKDFAEFVVVEKEEDAIDGKILIGSVVQMPSDFISFGDDVNERTYQLYNSIFTEETHDDDLRFLGHNKLIFYKPGKYLISYNARWIDFSNVYNQFLQRNSSIYDEYEIDVPNDILDCIPSYVASQCFKIDNEYKSSVYRNEYEMFLARIDSTDFKNTKTFKIGGDW